MRFFDGSMRSVSEMNAPRSRSFTYSTRISVMPACSSFATVAAASTSLALARISPVSVLTTSCARTLPTRYSVGTGMRSTPASSSWRTWRAVMRRPSSTMTLSPTLISKLAVSPRRRCGTSVSSMPSGERKNVFFSKKMSSTCSSL